MLFEMIDHDAKRYFEVENYTDVYGFRWNSNKNRDTNAFEISWENIYHDALASTY